MKTITKQLTYPLKMEEEMFEIHKMMVAAGSGGPTDYHDFLVEALRYGVVPFVNAIDNKEWNQDDSSPFQVGEWPGEQSTIEGTA